MKKKQSPNKASRENQIPKTRRGSHDSITVTRCIEPAVLALRKVSNMDRPPTPYSEVENDRASEQLLGPVYVPNKFMNGSQSYTQYARAAPSSSWTASRSPLISRVEGKPSNIAEVYRTSKGDVTLNCLPAVGKKSPLRLSNEELKSARRAPFLPKIDGNSKTNSGSLQNVVVCDYALKRSPQASSETIRLPPAKIRNGNITCTGNTSPQLCPLDKNISTEEVSEMTASVPKPPSVPCSKDRTIIRRKTKRRKDEDRNN